MREIIFEYGFQSVNGIVKKQYHLNEIPYIREKCDVWNKLHVAYVREWTGLTDKNGTKIFEGDILHKPLQSFVPKFIVEWNDKKACFDDIPLNTDLTSKESEFTIIGNIHENPELLK